MSRQTTTRRRHGVRRMSERKRLTITAITAVLALVTVVICALSGVFNFHKGNAYTETEHPCVFRLIDKT